MITGIYNLPKEICSAVGDGATKFTASADSDYELYEYYIKDAYSILYEDSKIMIIELDTSYDVVKYKINLVGNSVILSDDIIGANFIVNLIGPGLTSLSLGASKEDPDTMRVSFSKL